MRQRNIERLRHTQGCLTDCVAYLLNQHPARTPYFVYPRNGWAKRLKLYLRRHGYQAWWAPCADVPRRGTHLICGNSLRWKTAAHVVVYRNGRLVFDPQFPSRWKTERITHRLVLDKITAGEPTKENK